MIPALVLHGKDWESLNLVGRESLSRKLVPEATAEPDDVQICTFVHSVILYEVHVDYAIKTLFLDNWRLD